MVSFIEHELQTYVRRRSFTTIITSPWLGEGEVGRRSSAMLPNFSRLALEPIQEYERATFNETHRKGALIGVSGDDLPLGVLVILPSNLKDLRTIPELLKSSDSFYFSADGFNRPVRALRSDSLIAKTLAYEFANKPSWYGKRLGCGTANCFINNVSTTGDEEWSVALRKLLFLLKVYRPATVAIRAPKREDYESVDSTLDARDELSLTLYAAHIDITPPVLATFPVSVLNADDNVGTKSHAYILEGGWTDFGVVLRQLGKDTMPVAYAVVRLIRLVSDHDLLLFDMKADNMVARWNGTKYEVRMVDFDPAFTAEASRFFAERVSSSCTFCINSVLLLNMLFEFHPGCTQLLAILTKEVVDVWESLDNAGEGLCAMLAKDDWLKEEWREQRNFNQTMSHGEYADLMQSVFYEFLNRYGSMLILDRAETIEVDQSYLGRLIALMYTITLGGKDPRNPIQDDDALIADEKLSD